MKSEDTDKMLHDAAFHLGLHCLPKYAFMGLVLEYKGLMVIYVRLICASS